MLCRSSLEASRHQKIVWRQSTPPWPCEVRLQDRTPIVINNKKQESWSRLNFLFVWRRGAFHTNFSMITTLEFLIFLSISVRLSDWSFSYYLVSLLPCTVLYCTVLYCTVHQYAPPPDSSGMAFDCSAVTSSKAQKCHGKSYHRSLLLSAGCRFDVSAVRAPLERN